MDERRATSDDRPERCARRIPPAARGRRSTGRSDFRWENAAERLRALQALRAAVRLQRDLLGGRQAGGRSHEVRGLPPLRGLLPAGGDRRSSPNPQYLRPHPLWTESHRRNLWLQAETGGVLLTGMGNDLPYPVLWDNLLLDACQVTNPSIDPLREPMELRTLPGPQAANGRTRHEQRGPRLAQPLAPQLADRDADLLRGDVLWLDQPERAEGDRDGGGGAGHAAGTRARAGCTRT